MGAFAKSMASVIKVVLISLIAVVPLNSYGQSKDTKQAEAKTEQVATETAIQTESSGQNAIGSQSVIGRSLEAGPVVFLVLLILMSLSVLSWAMSVAKYVHLKKVASANDEFIGKFWENKSLNDLNSKLVKYQDSPAKELFKAGYSELVKGSQLKDQASDVKVGINAAMANLQRSLSKSKNMEKKKMEKYLPTLAIVASVGPFIGLFGTVWGIMNAFEGIAQTGNASLAAVAPGVSEALIATAFGLAAAIPAVVGYNMSNNFIRKILINIDGFGSDFMNIVERYLVSDKSAKQSNSSTPRI